MIQKTGRQEIVDWELFRIRFNVIFLVSGLIIFVIANKILPINWHVNGTFYMEIIIAYVIFANVIFTMGYMYTMLLTKKFILQERRGEVAAFARRFILIGGLVTNVLAGLFETLYRFQYMKLFICKLNWNFNTISFVMKISASIKSGFNQHQISVQTNEASKELDIPPKSSGYGSSVNGGEFLFLALATCCCNDLYREASKRKMELDLIVVEVSGKFGKEGEPALEISYKVNVTAPKHSDEAINDLIRFVDNIAEIHNTLRNGIKVELVD